MRCFTLATMALLVVLPACSSAPYNQVTVGGLVQSGDAVRFVVVQEWQDVDRVFLVTCPVLGSAGIHEEECWWQPVGDPRQSRGASSRAVAARAVASAHHGCALDDVQVQANGSSEGVEGYWLDVCGTQRFYQWNAAQRNFVEREDARR